MPDRLRAAFSPTLLGADLATFPFLRLPVFIDASFINCFFVRRASRSGRSAPRCGKANKTPGEIGFVLNSLVLFA